MSSDFGESAKSSSSEKSSNAADFECNICFDLARDPVVTLCGHLFCWPCLYRWLHHRSRSRGCPVCKAAVEEEKLVPLYGKGNSVTDSRMKSSYLGMEIPPRPSGQRPQTVVVDDDGDEDEEEEEDEDELVEEVEEEDSGQVAPPPDVRTLLVRLEQMLVSLERRLEQMIESIEQRLEQLYRAYAEQRQSINN